MWDIIFLLASTVVAFLFASIAASFVHQLRNPSLMRVQEARLAPSSAYASVLFFPFTCFITLNWS